MATADLFAYVSAVPRDRVALITHAGRLTFGALADAAQQLRPYIPADGAVAIVSSDLAEALTVLIAADGKATSVMLSSQGFAPQTTSQLLAILEPDLLLSDDPHLASCGATVSGTAKGLSQALDQSFGDADARTRWVLTTSGTTGQPKLVEHGLDSLTRTTKGDVDRGEGQVWGLLYDYSRFAGLQVVLQSLLSGATLVAPDLNAPLAEQITALAQENVSHLSATPTLWRKILMSPEHADLSLRQITMGGEIANAQILAGAKRAWGDARVSHIFASTEAGVGFSVTDGLEGFPASFLTNPPAGIGLKIQDQRLWVRNTKVSPQYLGAQGGMLGEDGWVDTGDSVEESQGRIYFRGRESGVINVGGNKVHPEEVERVLLSHPHVALARVYAKSNAITGALVIADIVPTDDAPRDELRKMVLAHAREQLDRYMVPAMLKIVSGFETNVAGKIVRGN